MDARSFARSRVEALLKPGGEVIGEPPRSKGKVRRVYVAAAPANEARALFEQLAECGREVPDETYPHGNAGDRRPLYEPRLAEIPDLGYVGYREAPTPTVDVNVSIEGLMDVKFKFVPAIADGGAGA